MIRFIRKLLKDRRGNALVIAGAALPLVVGSAGLATDTIQWTLWKRQLQRAADSGALAGAFGKLSGQTVTTGSCSSSPPISRDLTLGSVNSRLGTTPTCTVQSPPTSGSWTAASYGAVKVTVSVQRTLPFSSLFMSAAPTISASATAAAVQSGKYCMKSMDNKAETGISFSGSSTVNLGCGIITNAKGSTAIDGNGSATITASPVAAQGQIADSGVFGAGTTFQPYSPPTTDPFSSVAAPSVPSGCNQAAIRGNQNSVSASSGTVCYTGIKLTSGQTATLTDETIILNGGNLDVGAGATLTCTRCTFVLTTDASPVTSGSIGNVTINGGATVTLVAPTSGTYNGIVIYQDRRAPYCQNCNKINGNSSSLIEGAIYMPTQEVQFNGNGGINTNCVQMVAWQIQFTGNTSVSNVCPSGGPQAFDGLMVRLVE
jgi:hypothetical protein